MKPRRLFLTGASGFIGTNFISALDPSEWEVMNFDPEPPLDEAQQGAWHQGDIMDRGALFAAVQLPTPSITLRTSPSLCASHASA